MKKKFSLSRIGLGTVQFGIDYGFSKVLPQTEVDHILQAAHTGGITFLDTAREYGNSEQKIGKYCRKHPDHFVVATKLAVVDKKNAKTALQINRLLDKSIQLSQKNLGLQTTPIFLLHQTDRLGDSVFWESLADLKLKHGIQFGVSVYDPAPTLKIVEKWGNIIDCVQAPYNVLDRRFETLSEIFHDRGIVFITRSTFLKGALVEPKIPTELRHLEPIRKRLRALAEKSELSVSQLLTLFVMDAKFVDCSLVGASSLTHFKEHLGLGGLRKRYDGVREEMLSLCVTDPFLRDPRRWTSL